MKKLFVLALSMVFVLSGCSRLFDGEANVSTFEAVSTERPMEYISNHFLDEAMTRLGISTQDARSADAKNYTLNEKYALLGTYLMNNDARIVSDGNEDAEAVFKEIYEEMEEAVKSIQVILTTKDGITLDLTDVDSGYLYGNDFYKGDFISLVDNANSSATSKGVWKVSDNRWPSGVIRYRFDDSLSDYNKQKIKKAMDTWKNKTGKLSFVEVENTWYNALGWVTGTDWHVVISNKELDNAGGRSTIGYGAWRLIDFTEYHERTLLHELGHTIGLMHEHQRYDRDNYIEINWDNIIEDEFLNPIRTTNFGLIPKDNVIEVYVVVDINLLFYCYHWEGWVELARWENSRVTSEYDYDSVMHYGSMFGGLAKNNSIWSIRKKSNENKYKLGGDTLSDLDIQAVKTMY